MRHIARGARFCRATRDGRALRALVLTCGRAFCFIGIVIVRLIRQAEGCGRKRTMRETERRARYPRCGPPPRLWAAFVVARSHGRGGAPIFLAGGRVDLSVDGPFAPLPVSPLVGIRTTACKK